MVDTRRARRIMASLGVALAVTLAAPIAHAATAVLTVSLPHEVAPGVAFPVSISGSMTVAAAEVSVAIDPGSAASCPADPPIASNFVFRGPVVGPGHYGAGATPVTLAAGAYTVCGWLTAAADPTSVLATFGPFAVSAGGPQPGVVPAPVAALRVQPRPHRALRVTVTLKAPATVVLTLERVGSGGARSPVGSVTVAGHAGANTLTVTRWSGHVPARGSYVLVARTRTGAHRSAPRSSSFSLP